MFQALKDRTFSKTYQDEASAEKHQKIAQALDNFIKAHEILTAETEGNYTQNYPAIQKQLLAQNRYFDKKFGQQAFDGILQHDLIEKISTNNLAISLNIDMTGLDIPATKAGSVQRYFQSTVDFSKEDLRIITNSSSMQMTPQKQYLGDINLAYILKNPEQTAIMPHYKLTEQGLSRKPTTASIIGKNPEKPVIAESDTKLAVSPIHQGTQKPTHIVLGEGVVTMLMANKIFGFDQSTQQDHTQVYACLNAGNVRRVGDFLAEQKDKIGSYFGNVQNVLIVADNDYVVRPDVRLIHDTKNDTQTAFLTIRPHSQQSLEIALTQTDWEHLQKATQLGESYALKHGQYAGYIVPAVSIDGKTLKNTGAIATNEAKAALEQANIQVSIIRPQAYNHLGLDGTRPNIKSQPEGKVSDYDDAARFLYQKFAQTQNDPYQGFYQVQKTLIADTLAHVKEPLRAIFNPNPKPIQAQQFPKIPIVRGGLSKADWDILVQEAQSMHQEDKQDKKYIKPHKSIQSHHATNTIQNSIYQSTGELAVLPKFANPNIQRAADLLAVLHYIQNVGVVSEKGQLGLNMRLFPVREDRSLGDKMTKTLYALNMFLDCEDPHLKERFDKQVFTLQEQLEKQSGVELFAKPYQADYKDKILTIHNVMRSLLPDEDVQEIKENPDNYRLSDYDVKTIELTQKHHKANPDIAQRLQNAVWDAATVIKDTKMQLTQKQAIAVNNQLRDSLFPNAKFAEDIELSEQEKAEREAYYRKFF